MMEIETVVTGKALAVIAAGEMMVTRVTATEEMTVLNICLRASIFRKFMVNDTSHFFLQGKAEEVEADDRPRGRRGSRDDEDEKDNDGFVGDDGQGEKKPDSDLIKYSFFVAPVAVSVVRDIYLN